MTNLIWELDYYSRPILDEQQKKLWEVVICESPMGVDRTSESLFRYAQFCPGTQVNSGWLRGAIAEAMAQSGQTPLKIRFFRRQMTNMITKACKDLGLVAQPSRRTYALHQWLQERTESFYPAQPGYQPGQGSLITSAVVYPLSDPEPLPDALIGQKWAFVTLESQVFAEMAEWAIDFSEAFPLSMIGLDSDAKIPGVVLFSSRALPMAGWMSGLEMAFLKVEVQPIGLLSKALPARLMLETGMNDRWILAPLPTPQLQAEAENFESAKQKVQRVHFIAVQSHPEAESFAGFWLLQELNLA